MQQFAFDKIFVKCSVFEKTEVYHFWNIFEGIEENFSKTHRDISIFIASISASHTTIYF